MPRVNNNTSKQYVKIQSSQTIRVTSGLQYEDYTKQQSDVPNRMKVAPQWNKLMVLITTGQHTYPAEVAEWKTVKNLAKEGVLTIGEFTDVDNDGASAVKQELDQAHAEIKTRSLSEIAGE